MNLKPTSERKKIPTGGILTAIRFSEVELTRVEKAHNNLEHLLGIQLSRNQALIYFINAGIAATIKDQP